jgi:hypothetical protein
LLLFAGLACAALALGWWSFYRAPTLLTRTDNPRRAIADRAVPRGAILARDGQPLTVTSGEPGGYARQYLYPPLSPVLGYTDPTYGQSGMEASLDGYLRGVQGYPALTVWWSHLLDGQPPPGLDLRLTLDMDLQRLADETLGERAGALVLVDAASGELLAIASHPGFDANRIASDWEQIIANPGSPLLDRATLGRYPAADLAAKLLPQGVSAQQPVPQVYLPDGGAPAAGEYSPLQVALLAATLSNGGVQPAPSLVQAAENPQGGWTILPPLQEPQKIFTGQEAEALSAALPSPGLDLWGTSGVDRQRPEQPVTWYAGGTLPDFAGRRLALAVLLEADDPHLAETIGQYVLQAASASY